MSDLDQMLGRLGAMPIPADLTRIDDAVLAGLATQQREASAAPRLMGVAGAFALVVGLAGGGLFASEPATARPLSPFTTDSPLAPSTLLDVHS